MSEHDQTPNKPSDEETPADNDNNLPESDDSLKPLMLSDDDALTVDETPDTESIEPDTAEPRADIEADDETSDESSGDELLNEEDEDVEESPAYAAYDAREPINFDDDFDVAGALAAVTELDSLVDDEPADDVEDYDELSPSDTIEPYQVTGEVPHSDFQQPPFFTLERGQLASVVPAFILIGIGAWLTITLTTTDATLSPTLAASTLMLALGLILITRGITSGRWDRGSLFLGLSTAFSGGLLMATDTAIIPDTSLTIANTYPLFVSAVGAALFLTAIVGRQTPRYVALFGLALIISGGIGYALLNDLFTLNLDLQPIINTAVPVLLAIVAVVMIIPLVIRRRE